MLTGMRVGVLGATQVSDDAGRELDLGAPKPRALLAALALDLGRPVSPDRLTGLLWGETPPPGSAGTLQAYVAGLRRLLEPDRAPRSRPTVLVTEGGGYALKLAADQLDAGRFEGVVGSARARLGPLTATAIPHAPPPDLDLDVVRAAVVELDEATSWWRGEAYADLGDAPDAVAERHRLDEQRLIAVEDRLAAQLALGGHATAAAELEALTGRHPLRERLWMLRAVALARSGRQADALAVLAELRAVLSDELGLEPSGPVRDLQTAILRQDDGLDYAPPAAVRPTPPPARASTTLPRLPDWPMVGRDAQLDALAERLDAADAGTPQFAALVGEAGIGKTRLASELGVIAAQRGATLLIGRCSQDDGAPALWPWTSVLGGLGLGLPHAASPAESGDPDAEQFVAWDAICRSVLDASADRLVVVGIDDLHWSDASSLRVLRHLCDIAHQGRLMVVATWRAEPAPVGPLAEVAEAFARRHALSLHLTGLSAGEAADVVEAVASGAGLDDEALDALRERTDGNPFFLVEYARLLAGSGAADLAEHGLPRAVADVVTRRVSQLPEQTARLLGFASVVGRDFDLRVLAAGAGVSPLDALDSLEPALEGGLVRDEGADRFRFSHALVREGVYAGVSPSRRERMHGVVAESMEAIGLGDERVSEVARHWGLAGPGSAARAWRAAAAAAESATRVHAYEEAADWLGEALAHLALDPGAGPRDRYDLLMARVEALRWSGEMTGLSRVVDEAVALAEELHDPELVATAASAGSEGAFWQPMDYGQVSEFRVGALRRALADLPPDDSERRCRVMLSLAAEVYYASSGRERDALTEQAVAMARRLGDKALLMRALHSAFIAVWRPETARLRLAWLDEAVALAQAAGDEHGEVIGRTLRAAVCGELGMVDELWLEVGWAKPAAARLRMLYALLVLNSMVMPWLAMAQRTEEADAATAEMLAVADRMALPQKDDGVRGALLTRAFWEGADERSIQALGALTAETSMPIGTAQVVLLLRWGKADDAERAYRGQEFDLSRDDWFSLLNWSFAAEVAHAFGDAGLGARAYQLLSPFAGWGATAGSGAAMGPVDAFLAFAAAATGELDLARRHADDAAELCERWQIPLVAAWLAEARAAGGF